jgi:hypothetical protein
MRDSRRCPEREAAATLASPRDDAIVRRAYQQHVIDVLLSDGDKLWNPVLRRVDAILDDDGLVDRVGGGAGPPASADAALDTRPCAV